MVQLPPDYMRQFSYGFSRYWCDLWLTEGRTSTVKPLYVESIDRCYTQARARELAELEERRHVPDDASQGFSQGCIQAALAFDSSGLGRRGGGKSERVNRVLRKWRETPVR